MTRSLTRLLLAITRFVTGRLGQRLKWQESLAVWTTAIVDVTVW